MTAEEFKIKNPLETFLESRGVKMSGAGSVLTSNRCPMIEHKPDHKCVTINTDKQLWNCHDCKKGGDVITWIALDIEPTKC